MVEKIPMTAPGYAALGEELKKRQSVDRPRIIEHIAEARSHGDLSENAEYHAAKEEQSHNEGRIAELEDKLARADIIDISKLSGDTIKFGATVTLIDEDTDKKQVWQLVGEPEADAKKGRISITSPLARALIGKAKGASVEVVTPSGAKAYEVKKIEWSSDQFHPYGWLVQPKELDASKKHPLIVWIHGGPASAMLNRWPRESHAEERSRCPKEHPSCRRGGARKSGPYSRAAGLRLRPV